MIAEYNGTTLLKRYVHGPAVDEPLVEYTGQIWLEEIGLYYYKARYYDPDIRRLNRI